MRTGRIRGLGGQRETGILLKTVFRTGDTGNGSKLWRVPGVQAAFTDLVTDNSAYKSSWPKCQAQGRASLKASKDWAGSICLYVWEEPPPHVLLETETCFHGAGEHESKPPDANLGQVAFPKGP